MFARTTSLRSSIVVTLGAIAISACDSLPNADIQTETAALEAIALDDVDADADHDAQWDVEVEIEAAPRITITVPAGIAAIERRDAAKRIDGIQVMGGQPVLARSAAPSIIGPTGANSRERGALELSLFDGRSGNELGLVVVEEERHYLVVEIEDPCNGRPRCALHLRLDARWLGDAAVRISPDFEVAAEHGAVRLTSF